MRHRIFVFRDVRMWPEEQIAFARHIGPLHIMEPLHCNHMHRTTFGGEVPTRVTSPAFRSSSHAVR